MESLNAFSALVSKVIISKALSVYLVGQTNIAMFLTDSLIFAQSSSVQMYTPTSGAFDVIDWVYVILILA